MKNILIISSSPRKKRKFTNLMWTVQKRCRSKRDQVKMVRIMEQNIGFCRVLLLLEPLFLYNKYQKGGVFWYLHTILYSIRSLVNNAIVCSKSFKWVFFYLDTDISEFWIFWSKELTLTGWRNSKPISSSKIDFFIINNSLSFTCDNAIYFFIIFVWMDKWNIFILLLIKYQSSVL